MTPYDYQAKGAADFAAGKKDEKLYGGDAAHCRSYRAGWQMARLAAEREADAKTAPEPQPVAQTPAPTPPATVQAPPRAKDGAPGPAKPKTPKAKTEQPELF